MNICKLQTSLLPKTNRYGPIYSYDMTCNNKGLHFILSQDNLNSVLKKVSLCGNMISVQHETQLHEQVSCLLFIICSYGPFTLRFSSVTLLCCYSPAALSSVHQSSACSWLRSRTKAMSYWVHRNKRKIKVKMLCNGNNVLYWS